MRRTFLIALLVAVVASVVQACGTRGPLYLPPPESGDAADAQKKK